MAMRAKGRRGVSRIDEPLNTVNTPPWQGFGVESAGAFRNRDSLFENY
jgi:hypothetical protein